MSQNNNYVKLYMRKILKKTILLIPILLLILLLTNTVAQNADVNVWVNAPEYVSGTFEVTIDIENVEDLDCGSFDLSFDPDVINVMEVKSGSIGNIEIPIDMWVPLDEDTIKLTFNVKGVDGTSGSGYLSLIIFEVVGDIGDTSILDLSDTSKYERELGNKETNEIIANWFNGSVTIGDSTSDVISVVERTSAPGTPTATVTSLKNTIPDPDPELTNPHQRSEHEEPLTKIDFNYITVYSLIGLIAFIYTLKLLK